MGKDNIKKEKIADIYGLPKDVVLGASIISITDNSSLLIENFKKLLDYSSEIISIQCKNYILIIKGKRMEIEFYTKDELKINGRIIEMTYK